MQIPLRYHRGQKKPWGSIPRIDWSHPLAQGLVFYGYDTGAGNAVDLVRGDLAGKMGTTAANATSPFGSGLQYPGAGVNSSVQWGAHTPYPVSQLNGTSVYSQACGYYLTAAPGTGNPAFGCALFQVADPNSNTFLGPWVGQNSVGTGGPNDAMISYGTNTLVDIGGGVATGLNKFNTIVGVATVANTQSNYVNGALFSTTAVNSTVIYSVGGETIGLNQYLSGAGYGVPGFIYFAALWKRPLTAAEARQIHGDPYCFLIYPED